MVNSEYQKSLPNCESYYTELWKICFTSLFFYYSLLFYTYLLLFIKIHFPRLGTRFAQPSSRPWENRPFNGSTNADAKSKEACNGNYTERRIRHQLFDD